MRIYLLNIITYSFLQIGYSQKAIPLYDGVPPNSKSTLLKDSTVQYGDIVFMNRVVHPELIVYLPEKSKSTGQAVIICPGGGYSGIAIDHEGHAIAKKLQSNGIAGFVLKYRMPKSELVSNKEFVPLQDAQRAIQLVRENAKKWNIKPNQIGIQGNSAGGHLASTAGTHYQVSQIDNPKKTSLRPDFMILNYPVISFADSVTHKGSRYNLIGESSDYAAPIDQSKIIHYSNERQVDKNTPPIFITHSLDDKVVPIENSILFIAACQQNKVPVESYFYANGGHGYGMVNPSTKEQWIDNCITWVLKLKKK